MKQSEFKRRIGMIELHASLTFNTDYGIVHTDFWGKSKKTDINNLEIADPEKELKILQNYHPKKKLKFLRQIHSDISIELTKERIPIHSIFWESGDAAWSYSEFIPTLIRTADCIPLLFYHDSLPLIGGIHAGWKGLKQKIFTKTIHSIQKKIDDSEKKKWHFIIGPHNRVNSYEVKEDVYSYFDKKYTIPHNDPSKKYLNLTTLLVDEIIQNNFSRENIQDLNINNFHHPDLFSHRKKEKGRNIAIIYAQE